MTTRFYKTALLTAFAALTLTGCFEKEMTVRDICEQQPQLCSDIASDNWCNLERRKVIFSRYARLQKDDGEHQYRLLRDLESYSKCMELASRIEHKQLKEKQSARIESYFASMQAIDKLNEETRNSENPLLLYWHWSRNGNTDAIDKLLTIEGSKQVQTPELQLAYATYYAKANEDKTFEHLYRALSLYRKDAEVNPEIAVTLMTLNLARNNAKAAFIWGNIAHQLHARSLQWNDIVSATAPTEEQREQWLEQAEALLEKIQDGHFRAADAP
ncbi:DUF2989 domain-containing protein [Idiomarina tyrosinivorans]|uniref:DUF2989 domain-containing protein n=1 Tax=Idiomarina tyrosinivorans TaxID=1445662 RepID=A0A432ZTV9_9GAMM|nr:DUF2989 domain-containing protein [Idiomarina tyrosinivorans]RUO81281.1 DUF2989 domain-containing protein [Idiomarina tyrosinivorans]